MSKKNSAPFVDPETVARMQALREQEDNPFDDSDFKVGVIPGTGGATSPDPRVKELEAENSSLRERMESLAERMAKVEAERDNAIAQVVVLKAKATVSPVNPNLPDGSCVVSLVLDPDKTALYKSWAESYNMSFEQMVNQQIMEALDAYAG